MLRKKTIFILAAFLVIGIVIFQKSKSNIYTNTTLGISLALKTPEHACNIQGGIRVVVGKNCYVYEKDNFNLYTLPEVNYKPDDPYLKTEAFKQWALRMSDNLATNGRSEILDEKKINGMDVIAILNLYPTENGMGYGGIHLYFNNDSRVIMSSFVPQLSRKEAIAEEGALLEAAKNIFPITPTTGELDGLLTIGYGDSHKDGYSSEYPFHYVTIYSPNGLPAVRVRADRSSYINATLKPGHYFVYTDGKKKDIVIEKGKFTTQDINLIGTKDGYKRIESEMDAEAKEINENGDLTLSTKLIFFFMGLIGK